MHHHLPQTAKQGLQHAMQRKPMHCFGANAVPFSAGPHNMQLSCTSTLADPVRKANVPYFFLTFAPCYHSCHLTQQRWKGWWEAAQACLSCSLHTRCKKLPDIWSWARQARSCSIFSCSCNLIALQVHTKRQPCKERKKKKMTAPFCITSKRSQVLFRMLLSILQTSAVQTAWCCLAWDSQSYTAYLRACHACHLLGKWHDFHSAPSWLGWHQQLCSLGFLQRCCGEWHSQSTEQ